MSMKEYFVKVSYTDTEQPLKRVHANDIMNLDLTQRYLEVVEDAKNQYDCYGNMPNFTIDFMIEVPQEN